MATKVELETQLQEQIDRGDRLSCEREDEASTTRALWEEVEYLRKLATTQSESILKLAAALDQQGGES